MTKVESVERYQEIVRQYNRKGCVANDYIQMEVASLIACGALYEQCEANNAFLFVRKSVGFRMYYYLNDFSSMPMLANENYEVELLHRTMVGVPEREVAYLLRLGFSKAQLRVQLAGVCSKMTPSVGKYVGFEVGFARDEQEVGAAAELFNSLFDPLTGEHVSVDEYSRLLNERQIIVARDADGAFLGAAHVRKAGRVTELVHLAVVPAARRRGVGRALCDYMVERCKDDEKSRFVLFTQADNEKALSLYQGKGFVLTGKASRSMVRRSDECPRDQKF